ncbi:hypothetical protein [Stenotrophomonas panacihumi]|uniref:hypothetical protein n=1 Tax=Stenotrophomonas panacihumi TaxID=676599 RepID=UPI0011B2187B|nr:hypothetical protein [Stenotrophomonas panacihumi]
MDKWIDVLLKVGISKGAATIALGTGVLLALAYLEVLPVVLQPYLPGLWLGCVLACSFLVLDLIARLAGWAKNKVIPSPNVVDSILYSAYRNLDADEKRVLKVFVDRHVYSVHLKEFGSTHEELEPVRRLAQRHFLHVSDSYRLEGQTVEIDSVHFRSLVENSTLVGSRAPPRSFG